MLAGFSNIAKNDSCGAILPHSCEGVRALGTPFYALSTRAPVVVWPATTLTMLPGSVRSALHLALHYSPQSQVNASLVPSPVFFEPGDHIRIQPQRDRFFQWTVEVRNLHRLQGKRLAFQQCRCLRRLTSEVAPRARSFPSSARGILWKSWSPCHLSCTNRNVCTLLYMEMFLQEHRGNLFVFRASLPDPQWLGLPQARLRS